MVPSATSAWNSGSGSTRPGRRRRLGRKRFLYDLWGDAVNIASRMESQGTPGRIQITEPTHELLSGEFEYEPRGTVSVKGKGEMETWYLVGRREAVSDRADPWGARGGTP
jgi:class 3 adenylate cyclase